MVVDKLPHSLCVKWKEYRREKELKHATLLDFEKWIEVQAEVHDDFGIRTSKPPFVPPDHKLKHHGGTAVYRAVTAPLEVLCTSTKVVSLLCLTHESWVMESVTSYTVVLNSRSCLFSKDWLK